VAARRIALELTGDRGWRAIEPPGDGAYTLPLRAQDGDILAFGERKVAA
jgi:nitrogen fixation protein FixH